MIVPHIQSTPGMKYCAFLFLAGLNGRPVCMVRDDWYVTSSLFPHPLLKSHVLRKAAEPSVAFQSAQNLNGVSTSKSKSGSLCIHSHTAGIFSS